MKRSQIKQTKEDKKRLKELEERPKPPRLPNSTSAYADLRNQLIYITELIRKGWSNRTIVVHIAEKFGIKENTAAKHIREAIEWMATYNGGEYIKEVRAKQAERFESILEQAIADRKWKEANNILDNLNKLYGLYETKQKVEITSNEIQFKFGGVENNEENTDVSE